MTSLHSVKKPGSNGYTEAKCGWHRPQKGSLRVPGQSGIHSKILSQQERATQAKDSTYDTLDKQHREEAPVVAS